MHMDAPDCNANLLPKLQDVQRQRRGLELAFVHEFLENTKDNDDDENYLEQLLSPRGSWKSAISHQQASRLALAPGSRNLASAASRPTGDLQSISRPPRYKNTNSGVSEKYDASQILARLKREVDQLEVLQGVLRDS
jgi:hypothetical protein